ncbi:DoxX family protein [Haloarcula japonica]|uniref:DoxX family protein n=1 Tax=Haloarcula japonica (strain ATCC 49778 / DSM 6131 / JCM 7785 / NBRC 101032 / NCIMB 13157 / TR-1) TaxID=1227453 RepID=M0L0I9_HALJT|nr:DoxX family protein [Haloarcula japonica]EMA27051.1 DoxX family protein [Haloarcula japonica DSM 6131]
MALEGEFMLVGRVLLGFLFLYNGYNHFAGYEGRVGYAQYKGMPAPSLSVISSGVLLVLASIGIIAGIYPVISAGALAVFLIVATPLFHDFWSFEGEDRQNELNHFLKNVGLLGGTLVLLATGGEAWKYAVGIGLF